MLLLGGVIPGILGTGTTPPFAFVVIVGNGYQ